MDADRTSELRELLDVFKKRPQPDLRALLEEFKALTPKDHAERIKGIVKIYEERRQRNRL